MNSMEAKRVMNGKYADLYIDGDLMAEAQAKVITVLEKCESKKITEWASIKNQVREVLGKFLQSKTGRRPMILPIIMEI